MSDSSPENFSQDNFEDSLTRLQRVVQRLESGEAGLEASLEMFEEGTRLLRDCYRRLEQVEQRIEILTGFDSSGNPVTSPFDAASTLEKNTFSEGEAAKKAPRKRAARKAESPPVSEEDPQGELPF